MTAPIDWSRILLLISPIIAIQICLQIIALVDLHRTEKVRGNKWMWVAIIIVGELFGPIAYYFIAKREA